jgi:RES domain-containing protein
LTLGQIVAAIDGLAPAQVSGRAYRHQAVQWRYSQPGAGARTTGGRWNPPNSFATLYLGLSVDVVAAEFHRMAERAGRSPSDFMPRHLIEYEIELNELVDLTSLDALQAVALPRPTYEQMIQLPASRSVTPPITWDEKAFWLRPPPRKETW